MLAPAVFALEPRKTNGVLLSVFSMFDTEFIAAGEITDFAASPVEDVVVDLEDVVDGPQDGVEVVGMLVEHVDDSMVGVGLLRKPSCTQSTINL